MAFATLQDLSPAICIKDGETRPFGKGGASDVWLGVMTSTTPAGTVETNEVALKVLRRPTETDEDAVEKLVRAFQREVRAWTSLTHPNVLQFFGLCAPEKIAGHRLDPRIQALVSPYCSNKNVREYLIARPNTNRIALVMDVIKGLEYLHSVDVVHGDIKPGNVLIDLAGTALLADFGLAIIVTQTGFTTKSVGGAPRFSAIELLAAEDPTKNPKVTRASDVWAFGMTALEVLSGKMPFPRIPADSVVIVSLFKGTRPDHDDYKKTSEKCRPVSDRCWSILQKCWADIPPTRPSISDILINFSGL